jgi:hypothetical protein
MMRTAVFYARRHRRQLEAETLAYLRTTGAVLTQAEVTALNENIRDIKYSSGISLVAATGRLATVALGAFIDVPSVDLRAYEGFVATYTETTNTAVCLIGAAGAGELTPVDLVVDGAFTDTANWTEGTAWAVAGGVATYDKSGDNNKISQVGWAATLGALQRLSFTIASAGSARVYVTNAVGSLNYWYPAGAKTLIPGTYTYYSTMPSATSDGIGVIGYTAGDAFTIDHLSYARVTAPSALGSLLYKLDGVTRSFESNDGLNPNTAWTVTITAP